MTVYLRIQSQSVTSLEYRHCCLSIDVNVRNVFTSVPLFLSLLTASQLVLTGCVKVNTPVSGEYRVAISLSDGIVPLPLQISNNGGHTQLVVVNQTGSTPASNVRIVNGILTATLPDEIGELHAKFDSHGMAGELWLDSATKLKLPFTATLNARYRFFEKSLTDNVDASGRWAILTDSATVNTENMQMTLTQFHDVIDGELKSANHKWKVIGQAHGDDVFIAALGANQIWLLKGGFNQQGVLVGQLWHNSDAVIHWHAVHVDASSDNQSEPLPPITLPWPVPTR